MARYRWSEIAAGGTVPAAALAAMITACVGDRAEPVICESTRLACAPGWQCAADGQSCYPGTCGDGRVDRGNGEVCDFGDRASMERNGCINCLALENCGNGDDDAGEECDDGNDNPSDGCDPNCQLTKTCGDGVVDANEQCDDGIGGVRRATATCDEDCTVPWCGDQVVNLHFVNPATGLPEECEPATSAEPCDADCTLAWCGDGVHNAAAGEECDDGNDKDDDGCVDECKLARCGDRHLRADVEQCDVGEDDTADCNARDCTQSRCGDGHRNLAAGEACDDGNPFDFDGCRMDEAGQCKLPDCGDGVTRVGYEECDDGNEVDTDDCPSGADGDCQEARCGDGIVRMGHESCDKGGDHLECDSDCTPVQCGDGHVNLVAEQMPHGCESDLDCSPARCRPRDDNPVLCHCTQ